jgi:hypothetical protein
MFALKKYHECLECSGRYVKADFSKFVASTLEENERAEKGLQADCFQSELQEVDLPSTAGRFH